MTSLVVRGGTVVTQDDARRVLRADVRVEDGVVVAVGDAPGPADVEIDARDRLVVPGLVNLHTHAAMALFRGLGDDLPLERWLQDRIWPAERRMTKDDVLAGARVAFAEMIAGGTTSFNDMYFFGDATAAEAKAAGLRMWVGTPIIDGATPEMTQDEMPEAARRLARKWKGDPHVTPTISPHATYTCRSETLEMVRDVREQLGLIVHTHCSETRTEIHTVEAKHGARPVDVLERHGLLARSVLAHCGWITKDEARRIARAGGAVAHCPASNLKLATGGTFCLPEFHEAGGAAGLGTDGAASNNVLDMFQAMKLAALVHKNHRWDASVVPAELALDMATRDGARALGRPDLGRIAVGARADLVLVDTARPHMTPLHDPVSQLVYAARADDVTHVVVDGRVVYADRAFETLDLAETLAGARVAAARVAGSG